jgi:dTDP-4-amino-4,6-dideoxygalactose transaminase
VIGDDEALMDRCYSYHNFGRPYGSVQGNGFVIAGNKCRMAEFQAAILLGQIESLQEETTTRNDNAAYLTSKIKDIPGIVVHELSPQATRAAYHFYPFRYKKDVFNGLSRQSFLRALAAEGVPASAGYTPMQEMDFIEDVFRSKVFQKVYSKKQLDLDRYREENACPDNRQLCEEAVWLNQRLLLGTKKDVDDIADAIRKIYENRDKLA